MEVVFAIVGRPNVGKSTLFNRLTRQRQALVADMPGVTRDRQFGEGECQGQSFIVIDTPGLLEKPEDPIEEGIIKQTQQAVLEADIIFFVLDARAGLLNSDLPFAQWLRKVKKPVIVVANKMDGLDPHVALAEFYSLGFKHIVGTAAAHNEGIQPLVMEALKLCPSLPEREGPDVQLAMHGPKVAIIGKPNAGKSTLLNRMVGDDRMIVSDIPGTTRDSIYVPVERFGKPYILIDTAGIRRKKNVFEAIEKFSVIKTLQAVKDAEVVIFVFDAREGLSDQDLSLIDFAIEAGRGLIICANKWDGMSEYDRNQVKQQLDYRLRFASFASVHLISALHGTGVGDLFDRIDAIYDSLTQELSTHRLTDLLKQAITQHMPPMVKGRRIKLRYAHPGGHFPTTLIIHGNQTDTVPKSYTRYLAKYFGKALHIEGALVRIVYKSGENPYKDKPNALSDRQIKRRQRLMKHVKKLKKREKH